MLPDRYTIDAAVAAINNPRKFIQELNTLYHKAALFINSPVYNSISKDGDDYISKDWDNLLILDACRFDWFRDLNPINGQLYKCISPASESMEFMNKTFIGRDLHDTVYVTANPHAEKIPNNTFHSQINLLDSHWDPEHKTVLPEDMVRETLRANEKYPRKRLIAHFMQPHFPFIGEIGGEINHKGIEQPANEEQKSNVGNPWNQLNRSTGISQHQTIKAYRQNHEIAIESAQNLVNKLPGKSVITSDHANLIGEWTFPIPHQVYGHPPNFRKQELIAVPWLEIESNERREIVSEPPKNQDNMNKGLVESRLRDLGYTM